MSLIKLQGNASGTGALTIAAPNTNTDRTLTLPDTTGTIVMNEGSGIFKIDSSGNVGIGTTSPSEELHIRAAVPTFRMEDSDNSAYTNLLFNGGSFAIDIDPTGLAGSSVFSVDIDGTEIFRANHVGNVGIGTNAPVSTLHLASTAGPFITFQDNDAGENQPSIGTEGTAGSLIYSTGGTSASHIFELNRGASEAARITSDGDLLVGKTTVSATSVGFYATPAGLVGGVVNTGAGYVFLANRQGDDGILVSLRQANAVEGTISVSGTTVSYNGGHLSRWAQFPDNSRPELLKGTVMSNLDQMSNWDGEDNEQLNCVQVSAVEGDPDVAGVFVAWDSTDDGYNDILLAMTGDMVIRIGAGVTVARGDLLMSAGDGTAKPQGDDIVRSKTIAKVTSTHVSHTYADGSYAVPCVLMAC